MWQAQNGFSLLHNEVDLYIYLCVFCELSITTVIYPIPIFFLGVHLFKSQTVKILTFFFCHKICIFPTLPLAFCLFKFFVFNFRYVAFPSSQICFLFFVILIETSNNSPMLIWGHIKGKLLEITNDLLVSKKQPV